MLSSNAHLPFVGPPSVKVKEKRKKENASLTPLNPSIIHSFRSFFS